MKAVQTFTGAGDCVLHGPFSFSGRRLGAVVTGKVCPSCLALGQKRAEIVNEHFDAQHQRSERERRLLGAGVPRSFLEASFDNFRADPSDRRRSGVLESLEQGASRTKIHHTLKQYAQNFSLVLNTSPPPGAIVCGKTGTGKTHLAAAMISSVMDQGYSAAYAALPVLLTSIREASRFGSDHTVTHVIGQYSSPHLLILDEYGKHTFHESDYQSLFTIVDKRYQNGLPTILISNVQLPDIRKELDPSLMDRIIGKKGPQLQADWPSWRAE